MPPVPAKVLTITELTRGIKLLLEDRYPTVWIEGEISNLRVPASGHFYFTLKDANAQIAAVMFRGMAGSVKFKLRDGLQVVACGQIGVYEKSGQYQIICRQLMPKGLGALQLAFEELKQKLAREGLFDPARKKPIPMLPQRIGLVTSPTGAAIRDFLNVIGRRYPNIHIVVNPVRVQGDGAAAEIAAAIDQFNALHADRTLPVDVIIATRGGGSLEDLWSFNEEIVARAIARSVIPVISAVGHEIDFTIADFVADLRAPTPSAAAELVVKPKAELAGQLDQFQRRLDKDLRLRVTQLRQRFRDLAGSYVFRQPAEVIRQYQQQVDGLSHRLRQSTDSSIVNRRHRVTAARDVIRLLSPRVMLSRWRERLTGHEQRIQAAYGRIRQLHRHRFDNVRAKLDLLSPKSTLERGYSITLDAVTGKILRSVSDAPAGARLRTKLVDGDVESVVNTSDPI
jgi:exodeoxyribonuclease VII large subunit